MRRTGFDPEPWNAARRPTLVERGFLPPPPRRMLVTARFMFSPYNKKALFDKTDQGFVVFPGRPVNPPPSRTCPGKSAQVFSPVIHEAVAAVRELRRCRPWLRGALGALSAMSCVSGTHASASKKPVIRQGRAIIGLASNVSTLLSTLLSTFLTPSRWVTPIAPKLCAVGPPRSVNAWDGMPQGHPLRSVPKIWSAQSLSSSLIDVFDRVRSSTRLMITAQ